METPINGELSPAYCISPIRRGFSEVWRGSKHYVDDGVAQTSAGSFEVAAHHHQPSPTVTASRSLRHSCHDIESATRGRCKRPLIRFAHSEASPASSPAASIRPDPTYGGPQHLRSATRSFHPQIPRQRNPCHDRVGCTRIFSPQIPRRQRSCHSSKLVPWGLVVTPSTAPKIGCARHSLPRPLDDNTHAATKRRQHEHLQPSDPNDVPATALSRLYESPNPPDRTDKHTAT